MHISQNNMKWGANFHIKGHKQKVQVPVKCRISFVFAVINDAGGVLTAFSFVFNQTGRGVWSLSLTLPELLTAAFCVQWACAVWYCSSLCGWCVQRCKAGSKISLLHSAELMLLMLLGTLLFSLLPISSYIISSVSNYIPYLHFTHCNGGEVINGNNYV